MRGLRALAKVDTTVDRRLRQQTWIMIGTVITFNAVVLGISLAF